LSQGAELSYAFADHLAAHKTERGGFKVLYGFDIPTSFHLLKTFNIKPNDPYLPSGGSANCKGARQLHIHRFLISVLAKKNDAMSAEIKRIYDDELDTTKAKRRMDRQRAGTEESFKKVR
jgi:hypothetical protein